MAEIVPGDQAVYWSSFPESEDKKIVFIDEKNDRKKAGVTTEKIVAERRNNTDYLKRIQVMESEEAGNINAMTIVEKDSFMPLYHEVTSNGETTTVNYHDSYVEVNHSTKIPIKTQVFETHTVEMIIRLLPLQFGYKATLSSFHPGKEKVITVNINVVSNEMVTRQHNELVEAWKLEVDFDGHVQYYWVGVDGNELLKQESPVSYGARMIFERE
ncbi:hypothetical protein [Virgibacillus doumboii]|uniref:hypothetical protein n=1 Tax=Virgibacillus doumboii TaxID=2697503 RepID=UPI0013DEB6E2|nr:hypothetical protein [Virgibacillus doumboii]